MTYQGTILISVGINITNFTFKDFTTEFGEDVSFYDVRSTLTYVDCEPNCQLESIPDSCFSYCEKLEKAYFSNCIKLTSIGGYAFHYCESLNEIQLPTSLKSIGDYAFEETSLYSVTIPKSVNSFGERLFSYSALESIIFEEPSNIASIGSHTFFSTKIRNIILPSSLQTISGDAFWRSYIESISIHENNPYLIQIDDVIYSSNQDVLLLFPIYKVIENFEVPSIVKSINSYCFSYSILSSLTIPEGIAHIPSYCFAYCNITSIKLPSTIKSLGSYSFYYSNLYFLNYPDATEGIGNKTIFIPSLCETIGDYGFAYSTFPNQEITIPSTWKIIPQRCFYNCKNITNIIFNEGLETIDYLALSGCSIKKLTMPSTILYLIHPFLLYAKFPLEIESYEGKKYILDDQQILYNEDQTILIQETSSQFNSYTIPFCVKQINSYAFYKSDITSITFEEKSQLSYIGISVFEMCFDLLEIHLYSDNGVSLLANSHFARANIIDNIYVHQKNNCSLTFFATILYLIGYMGNLTIYQGDNCSVFFDYRAFYSGSVYSLHIYQGSNSFISMSNQSFDSCSMRDLYISQGKGSSFILDSNAFYNNYFLRNIDFGDYLFTISDNCFEKCRILETLKIPAICISIGNNAFKQCYSLQNIEFADNSKLNIIGNNAFESCYFVTFFVPSLVSSIGSSAFYNCTKLKIINIPRSVKEVGKDAFLKCNNLSPCLDIDQYSLSFVSDLINISKLPSKCVCELPTPPILPNRTPFLIYKYKQLIFIRVLALSFFI